LDDDRALHASAGSCVLPVIVILVSTCAVWRLRISVEG